MDYLFKAVIESRPNITTHCANWSIFTKIKTGMFVKCAETHENFHIRGKHLQRTFDTLLSQITGMELHLYYK